MSTMTLEQVRDELRATADHADSGYDKAWAIRLADAIDAHLREREAAFERGYVRGYDAALGAAAAECRRQAGALDHGGNEYIRYADAIKCAAAIGGLRAPEPPGLNKLSGNSGQLPNGVYVIDRGFQVERGQSIPTVLVGFGVEDWDARDAFASMLAAAPKPESPAKGFERICERGTAKTKPEAEE